MKTLPRTDGHFLPGGVGAPLVLFAFPWIRLTVYFGGFPGVKAASAFRLDQGVSFYCCISFCQVVYGPCLVFAQEKGQESARTR